MAASEEPQSTSDSVPRRGWLSRVSPRGIAIDVFFHLFVTISAATLTALGAASWRTLETAVLIGLVADLSRHCLAPECRVSPADMWRQFEQGTTQTAEFKARLRFWKRIGNLIAGAWLGYLVLVTFLTPTGKAVSMPAYTKIALPLENAFASFSRLAREATASLVQSGYQGRAEVVSLIYSSNFLIFLIWGVAISSGYTMTMTLRQLELSRQKGGKTWSTNRTSGLTAVLFIAGVLGHAVLTSIPHHEWTKSGHLPFADIAHSNNGLYRTGVAELGAIVFMSWAYQFATAARCMAVGLGKANNTELN